MKSLEARHAERAYRKLENASDGSGNAAFTVGGIGNAAYLIEQTREAVAGLSDEERSALYELIKGDGDLFSGSGSPVVTDFSDYAGIGIVNPLIVPPAGQVLPVDLDEVKASAGNGGAAWVDGNVNGRAVKAASNGSGESRVADVGGNGWGAGSGSNESEELPTLSASMKVEEIEAIAAKEGVSLDGATNKESRIELIEKARAAKSAG